MTTCAEVGIFALLEEEYFGIPPSRKQKTTNHKHLFMPKEISAICCTTARWNKINSNNNKLQRLGKRQQNK